MTEKKAIYRVPKIPKPPSHLEALLAQQMEVLGIPEPAREYKFCLPRRWRFDFAWPSQRIAVEVEGGTWNYGRHQRPLGFENDCEKYNEAAFLGWRVFRFTKNMIESGDALATIQNIFSLEEQ